MRTLFGEKDVSFVQLEIQVGTLQRLITQHTVSIEEIHCLDGRSKCIIQQALIDAVAGSTS